MQKLKKKIKKNGGKKLKDITKISGGLYIYPDCKLKAEKLESVSGDLFIKSNKSNYELKTKKTGKIVIANINIEIPTNAKTEDKAIAEAENYELPKEYVEDSFEIVKIIDNEN